MRIRAYVDGFNVYHAVAAYGDSKLKWLDLSTLLHMFAPTGKRIELIYYFSAYATWKPESLRRHKAYVKALETTGVIPVMGRFREKDASCHNCGKTWINHEEKETDVNLAIRLLLDATDDKYDLAMVVSADSDLIPAIKEVKARHPNKYVRIVTPSNHDTATGLVHAAGGNGCHSKIQRLHVERSLFPEKVGAITRPVKYS